MLKRFQTFIASLIVMAIGATATVQAQDFRAAAKKVMPATTSVAFTSSEATRETNPIASRIRKVIAFGKTAGVCISPDGLIVCPYRKAGDNIKVTFPSGKTYDAKLAVVDHRCGLALLKVNAKGLPSVKLAKGDPSVGESVLACGSIGDTERTLASGIVSASNRRVQGTVPSLLQTDINAQSAGAGSPIVNVNGQLFGVARSMPGNMTMAIGPGHLKRMLSSAKKDSEAITVTRGFLGVQVVSNEQGVKIRVREDGPAAKAGFKDDEIIVAIDGEPVNNPTDVISLIGKHTAGETVTVTKLTDDGKTDVKVKLGALPATALAQSSRTPIEVVQPEQLQFRFRKDLVEQLKRHGFDPDQLQFQVQPGKPTPEAIQPLQRLLRDQAFQVQRSNQAEQVRALTKQLDLMTKKLDEVTKRLSDVQAELESERKKNQK